MSALRSRFFLSVFLVTSDGEIPEKGEGTLHGAY